MCVQYLVEVLLIPLFLFLRVFLSGLLRSFRCRCSGLSRCALFLPLMNFQQVKIAWSEEFHRKGRTDASQTTLFDRPVVFLRFRVHILQHANGL